MGPVALVLFGLFLQSCLGLEHRQEKGLLGEVLKGINLGIDHFQSAAKNEASRLRTWAEKLEEEMRPASRHNLEGNHPLERVDNESAMPGLHDLLFRDALNPFAFFGLGSKKWWEGENVCMERNVIKDDLNETTDGNDGGARRDARFFDMSFTTCKDGDNFHECTTRINANGIRQSVTLRYECCYGYHRDPNGNGYGCSELVMNSMKKTLDDLGTTEFIELLKSSKLLEILDNNVTIFVPSNDAVEDFRHDLQRLNAVEYEKYSVDDGLLTYRKKREVGITVAETPQLTEIIKGHIVNGFVDTTDIEDENVIDTLITEENKSKLRFSVYNTYPKNIIMANCAKVTSANHYTINGVVHIVDKVIMPATKTISEVIASDVQFRTLHQILQKSNLTQILGNEGQLTLFAPTDTAFQKLEEKIKQKLLSGNGCSIDILKHHILPNVICSGVVESKAKTVNINNKFLILSRDEDDNLMVEGKKIVARDIIATNGVIHLIEDIIIPETARSIDEALETEKMTTWKELFRLAGLQDILSDLSNVTLFVPSESALKELPESYIANLKGDPAKLKDFLMYHVAYPKTCHCDFANNKILDSGLTGKKVRLNAYGGLPLEILDANSAIYTAQCARITHVDSETCGGMIHTISKVLIPPAGNLLEVLQYNEKHKLFLELVSLADLQIELNKEGPFTVFAPTDAAFEGMKEDIKKKVFSDKQLAAKVVKHHILPDHLCCSGISRNVWFFDRSSKRTLGDEIITVRRSNGGYLYADRAEITVCDAMANNGVVHGIDRVLLPNELDPLREDIAESRHSIFHQFQDPLSILFEKK